MSAHTHAMMRIVAAVARAKRLSLKERRELQAEFERDPQAFLHRYASHLTSVADTDLALFKESI